MAEADVRVALLARAGAARDQLHRALNELGATLVAEGDPIELDPADVAAKSPTLIVVSLEPAIESALDRFDDLLSQHGVEVMYDDAEVTRQLDGWDLNRWARHLAAKLLGRDVLPPPPEGADAGPLAQADLMPAPGAPPTPAQLMDEARFEDYAQDAPELAEWVPSGPSLTAAPAPVSAEPAAAEPVFEMETSGIEKSLQDIDAGHAPMAAAPPAPAMSANELTLDSEFTMDVDLSHLEAATAAPVAAGERRSMLELEDDSSTLADFEVSAEPVRFSQFGQDEVLEEIGDLDADVAALAAQLEAFEKTDTRETAREPDFSLQLDAEPPARNEAPRAAASAAAAPAAVRQPSASFDFSNLSLEGEPPPVMPAAKAEAKASSLLGSSSFSLEPIDEAPAAPAPAKAAAPTMDFASTLTLEGEPPPPPLQHAPLPVSDDPADDAGGEGAVLILAGLGGPDAVRQLLSSLPEHLPVPVLLYQHLEVGKHERLVEQLAKISRLPVALALAGASPKRGQVSVLGSGMSAEVDGKAMRFAEGKLVQILTSLRAANSAVLMLSGADAELVPAALALGKAGGLVLAQDPDNCFDPAAAAALKRQGIATYPALGLARQVAERWA
jgi:chemotaxis response regulator CheB